MKVLYISSWEIGLGKGKVNFIYEQVEQLKEIVDAEFIEVKFESRLRYFFNKKDSFRILRDRWEGVTYYEYTHYRWPSWLIKKSLLADFESAAKEISNHLISDKPDIIHAHVVLPAGLLATKLGDLLNVPVILQEHSAPFEMHLDSEEKRKIVKKVLSNVDKVVAVGPALKQRLASFIAKDKIIVIPNLLTTNLFSPKSINIIEGNLKIISVGGLVKRKRYDLLIETVGYLKNEGVDVDVVIAGEGSERDNLQNLIDAFKLQKNVFLLGHVGREELKSVYQHSNIYVHTSERETFGLAPAEALLCGIPVVTVKCEGPEYYVNEKVGIITEDNSVTSIADAIKYVGFNLDKYSAEVLNAYITNKFGKRVFLHNYLSLYNSLLN